MSKQREDELDIDRRTETLSRNASIVLGLGVAMFVLGAFVGATAGIALGGSGIVLVLLGVRARRALGVVGRIRAATEANARADHAQVEAMLAAELARGQSLALRLPILELLTMSLVRRGAMREIDDVLTRHLGDGNRGDRGPLAESYARLYALWALARASVGARSVDDEARRIEGGGAMDSRATTRLALARAVCAARAKDHAKLLSVLEPFERVSNDVTMQERALGRALRALGERGELADGYRAGSAAHHQGPVGQWVASVYAPAAPFVDEQSARSVGEPTWASAPTVAPAVIRAKRGGPRPLDVIQRWLSIVAVFFLVAGGALVMEPTIVFAFGLLVASVVLSTTAVSLSIVRRVKARKQLALLREGAARSLEGRSVEAAERAGRVALSRDPSLSATALLRRIDALFCVRPIAEHLADLDLAFARLAWLPSGGANTITWASAVLTRPRLLAMAGREAEAEAALAFALKSVIEVSAGRGLLFSVRFWTALSLGRRDAAIELARSFDARVPIDGRTELARDIALALGDPSATLRIRERMRGHRDEESLFRNVCPWLLDALSESNATGVRVDATSEREIPQPESDESRSVDAGDGEAKGAAR